MLLINISTDTFADYLQSKGWQHISLSDMIRAEIRNRKEEINLPNLIRVGNELRYSHLFY